MIFLSAALVSVCAQAATQPTLPLETVSLALPTQGTSTCPTLTTGTNCRRYVPAGDAISLQDAINAATCGDTIVLAAGSTYSGNFNIPSTSCSGWIEIVSSGLSSLPTPGNRVGPSNASHMATISTPNTFPAIQFKANSNHWRFIGLEITTSYVSTKNVVYYIVATGETLSVQSQLPDFIIFDRIYIHGLSATNTQHGIGMSTQAMAIVDSYCDEIHSSAFDSQCFLGYNGNGPFLIQNNFIQAAGENIMFGGAVPLITNLVPSDITIVGNQIQKNLTWRGQAAPYNWVVKNLFELKIAQRVLLDGNVIQDTWSAGQDEALIIRTTNAGGDCPWCVVQDVTVTHNIIQHAPMAIVVADYDCPGMPCIETRRVLIQNNLLSDINRVKWGGAGWLFQLSMHATPPPSLHDVIIDHNTGFEDARVMYLGDSGPITNFQLTNNIFSLSGGIIGGGTVGLTSTFARWVSPPYVYDQNLLIDSTGNPVSGYLPHTLWKTQARTGFTRYSGTPPDYSGNFQLTSSSPYHDAGTDGKDVGVWDWACLNNDSAAALAGKFVPGPNGCALSVDLLLQPPTNVKTEIQ